MLTSASAQRLAPLMTYGPKAHISSGDDDQQQIIFFSVPTSLRDTLYVRLYDPDCGGARDERIGDWDSETRFRLYGGIGAFSSPTLPDHKPSAKDLTAGTLIADQKYGVSPFLDEKWITYAKIAPSSGEQIGLKQYFKLLIETISGNEGNLYNVTVSSSFLRNAEPSGLDMFSYVPTMRVPEKDIHTELRFTTPKDVTVVQVHNFDAASAAINVETKFRSGLAVKSSKQGAWEISTVELTREESTLENAITVSGGTELPNDITFRLTDKDGNSIPLRLPIKLLRPNNRPVPSLTWTELPGCRTIMFNASKSWDADNDPLEFLWNFGDGSSGRGERIVHEFADAGTYNVELIVTDNSGQIGNSSRKISKVIVNQSPDAVAGQDQKGKPGQLLTFDGSGSSDKDGRIIRYRWEPGDGTIQEGQKITHAYREPGYYMVTLQVIDNSTTPRPCNSGEDSLFVWINAPPEVEIGGDLIAAITETVALSGSNSFDSDGSIVGFSWELGDGTKKEGMNVSHSYTKASSYRVKLTVEDNSGVGNRFESDFLTVVVNDPPIAKANSHRTIVSPGDVVNFDGLKSYDNDGKLINFDWDYGDGSKGNGLRTTHSYIAPGVYVATLTIKDNSRSKSDLDSDTVAVMVNFTPAAKAGEDQMVSGSEVQFDGKASSDRDGELVAYQWDFDDGTTSSEVAPLHVYAHSGTYNVKLTVTDNSKTSTATHSDLVTIIVNEHPIADAGPDRTVSPGESVSFDASSSIDTDGSISKYIWDFGDGTTRDVAKVDHAYIKSGKYNAQLTVFDNSGHSIAVGYDETVITVNNPPVSIAGNDQTAAPGQWINLNGAYSYDVDGKITAYRWDIAGIGKVSENSKLKYKFDKPGIYNLTLTVVDNSGAANNSSRDVLTVIVNNRPTAHAGSNLSTCELTATFDGSQSTDADGDQPAYRWDFGDGTSAKDGIKVNHTYLRPGVYPVILTVDDGNGLSNSTHSNSITVSINLAPEAFAGEDKTVCAGDVVLFDGGGSVDPEGGLLKYRWDFGDGTTADGINPTKTFTDGGVYSVSLTIEDDSGLPCNSDVDRLVIRVAESPVADAGDDLIVCAGTRVAFNGSRSKDFDGLVNSYHWDFGDGSTGGGATPSHVFTIPGVYLVTLRITGDPVGDCDNTDSDELTVTVHEAPIAQFTSVNLAPVNTKVEFDASASSSSKSKIIAYKWDFGDSSYAEGVKTSHTYQRAGRYFVNLSVETDAETSCNSTTVKNLITINDPPMAEAGSDQFLGINVIAIFDGSGSLDPDGKITKYKWDFGDGSTANGVQVRHRYTVSGNYKVKLLVVDDTDMPNNSSSDLLAVTVNATPLPIVEWQKMTCVDETVTFSGAKSTDADGKIASYSWNFGDGNEGEGVKVTHAYKRPGSYLVTLTVDDGSKVNNSVIDTTVQIKVNHPPTSDAGVDQIACPNVPVKFDGAGSYDIDGKLTSFKWDFGDGDTGEGRAINHTYSKSGTFRVRLTVTDNSGSNCATSVDECIVTVNSPPIAVAGQDQQSYFGGVHDDVYFDGSASSDPDKNPLTYSWSFGDGTSAKGPRVSHKYSKPGRYVVKLTVDDGSVTSCSNNSDELIVTVVKRK